MNTSTYISQSKFSQRTRNNRKRTLNNIFSSRSDLDTQSKRYSNLNLMLKNKKGSLKRFQFHTPKISNFKEYRTIKPKSKKLTREIDSLFQEKTPEIVEFIEALKQFKSIQLPTKKSKNSFSRTY